MKGLWLASYVVLWVVVLALVLLVLGMLQQIGLLRRHSPITSEQSITLGGPNVITTIPSEEEDGPSIGSPLPRVVLTTANGYGDISLPALQESEHGIEAMLLVCLQPLCESCQLLVDALNRIADGNGFNCRVVVLLRTDQGHQCGAFQSVFPVHLPLVCDGARTLMMDLGVHGSPFSLFYNSAGLLARKGVTKTEEEFQSFLEAASAQTASNKVFEFVDEA